jgi:hypothetical protein
MSFRIHNTEKIALTKSLTVCEPNSISNMGLFGYKLVIGGALNPLIKNELNWSFRKFHSEFR